MSAWISVKERLPPRGKAVISCFISQEIPDVAYQVDKQFYCNVTGAELYPTHWQPLPAPPEDLT